MYVPCCTGTTTVLPKSLKPAIGGRGIRSVKCLHSAQYMLNKHTK